MTRGTYTAGRRGRGGFTLVELMVVISIIAVLAALTAGGIGKFRTAAIRAQAAAEIGQLTGAIGAFKAQFKVDYLPSSGNLDRTPATGTPTAFAVNKFRLRSSYTNATTPNDKSFEAQFLKQMFPNLDLNATGLTSQDLDPNQCLVFFLSGGTVTNFTGFSTNKAAPFTAATGTPGEVRIGPFFEFPATRISGGQYLDPWKTPYAYFSSGVGANYPGYGTLTGITPAATVSFSFPFTENGLSFTSTVAPFQRGSPLRFEQQKSFQIISAGPNRVFGRGGDWKGTNASDYQQKTITTSGTAGYGYDDLSSFVGGQLGQAE